MKVAALLLALPAALHAGDFSFDNPTGPQFTSAQKQAQREAGTRVMPRVLAAFDSASEAVRIPAGDYRFGMEGWGSDGVRFPLQFTGLQRDDTHPFTIDASGATFWFDLPDDQAPTCHFGVGFKECRNIIFKGATIDRATRGHVEGSITRFDFASNRIELKLSPGITVPTTFNDKLDQRVIPFKADGSFCAPLYALQSGGTHLKYQQISAASADDHCWVTMHDSSLLETIRTNGLLRVGDGLSCVYTVTSALELVRSSKLTMDDIHVYAAKAWGAEHDGDGAHVWKNCYFGPRPGTSQWQGGEGFMFNATRHGTTLDNVTICHTTDDTANFHGYWSPVIAISNANRVTFGNNEETRRALPHGIAVGDAVIFLARESGAELGRAKLTAIDGDTVTLDQPAAAFAKAIAEWPDHECGGWLIENCDWHDNYQRLLIQSGPGTLRNCRFTRFGSAIELNSVMPYVEGGVPRDIRIENNVFTDLNPQSGAAAITVYAHAFQPGQAPLLHNITITGNTFSHPNNTVLALSNIDGGLISNNHFPATPNPIQLTRCTNVTLLEPKK